MIISMKKKNEVIIKMMMIVVLGGIGLFNIMGVFGFTAIGNKIFGFFEYFLGKYAFVATLICFGAAFFLWRNLKNSKALRNKNRMTKGIAGNQTHTKKTREKVTPMTKGNHRRKSQLPNAEKQNTRYGNIEIPGGKLVSMRGFVNYFETNDWAETDTPKVDYQELGKDFSTYFGEGREPLPAFSNKKVVPINGFHRYFSLAEEEIAAETEEMPINLFKEKSEQRITPNQEVEQRFSGGGPIDFAWNQKEEIQEQQRNVQQEEVKNPLTQCPFPGQVTSLIDGVTNQEREILLGKPSRTSLKEFRTGYLKDDVKAGGDPLSSEIPEQTEEVQPVTETHQTTRQFLDPIQAEKVTETDRPMPFSGTKRIWTLPDLQLLEPVPIVLEHQDTHQTANRLEEVLQEFGVNAKVIRATSGPTITRYELAPAPGVKISKIVNLADDITLALAARDVRIEAPIPGKAAIGVEIPNQNLRSVTFREVLETATYTQYKSKLKTSLGKDISNQTVIADLSKMPHLLIAGATGSGKSVCITALINSLLMNAKPSEVRLMLIDPKMVELNQYNGIPHLLIPVVNDSKKAAAALKWIVKEMETRYELFAAANVRDIERYNQAQTEQHKDGFQTMPWIVVVIDELADLMMVAANEVEESICRLAQMARAAGIHLVIATQRPSVDVITGVIKANIPSRISFAVSSQIDSRTILDAVGAEKLMGKGDMLYLPQGQNKSLRVQGCLLTDTEVERIIEHWKRQGKPDYLDPQQLFENTTVSESTNFDDELFYSAGELLIATGMASVTFLQRRLKIGYARAARIMDMLEENGVVGSYEGSKPRQVLLTEEEFNERFAEN